MCLSVEFVSQNSNDTVNTTTTNNSNNTNTKNVSTSQSSVNILYYELLYLVLISNIAGLMAVCM